MLTCAEFCSIILVACNQHFGGMEGRGAREDADETEQEKQK